jgi:hypothetical protein
MRQAQHSYMGSWPLSLGPSGTFPVFSADSEALIVTNFISVPPFFVFPKPCCRSIFDYFVLFKYAVMIIHEFFPMRCRGGVPAPYL